MYLIYLAVSLVLTVWVGRTLFRNGLVFLEDSLGSVRLAQSVNHLLVVGFYLLNLGFVSVALRAGGAVDSATAALEELSLKIGMVLLVLGAVHFLNLLVLSQVRRRRSRHGEQPDPMLASLPPMPPMSMPPLPPHPAERPRPAEWARPSGQPAPRLTYPVNPMAPRGPEPES
jgi:hypothetical protein